MHHCFSALKSMRYLLSKDPGEILSIHTTVGILMESFMAHWRRWVPSGSLLTEKELPLYFLLQGVNSIYCHTFRPDWAFSTSLLPRLLVQFDSSRNHDDECELQVQLLCTFKLAHHHVPDDKKNRFFLMGIFITKQWNAYRWVVYKKKGEKIIFQKKLYYLKDPHALASFIRLVYNYTYYVYNFGPIVEEQDVDRLAREVLEKYPRTLDGPGHDNGACQELESTLLDSGYAMGGEIKKGVFRVLRKGMPFIAKLGHPDELSFLRHLSSTESAQKHTLDLLDTLESRLGQLMILPMHHCLDKIDIVNTPLIGWTIQLRRQLVDGVAFLHKLHIAHLDIKPSNIVYDFKAQRLFIIDFDVAVWCNDAEAKVKIGWGTDGWTAPEVALDEGEPMRAVNPIRVDLWSCGRVLKWVDQFRKPYEVDADLTRLSLLLMDQQPEYRPLLHEMINEDPGFWCSDRLTQALDSHCENVSRLRSLESVSRSRTTK
ncbi:hypothetical protein E1B28_003198 [Marasmius oreades]|uniref:Protein kinase domain-containing protein n=1 Tax=Marasmius oreades TaxID=181124 RepID=A0A9P7UJG5_9AGAR|nr:uncharacterized protein E1B28_003198 [Marasmius oreades]KAG7085652.1 hypothetical protein E1B28_003198 [Marasmius oreades]